MRCAYPPYGYGVLPGQWVSLVGMVDALRLSTLRIDAVVDRPAGAVGWISAAHPPPSDHDAANRRRGLPKWPGVGHFLVRRASRRKSGFVPAVGRYAG